MGRHGTYMCLLIGFTWLKACGLSGLGPWVALGGSAVRKHWGTFMRSRYGLVVGLPGGLPATLPSTLEKVLSGAVLTEEFLVLPVASIQLQLSAGVSVGMPEFLEALISLGGGSVRLSTWNGSLRDLYPVLYGSAL